MPRLARVIVPQFAHHITQRGNRRRDVFFTPGDRQVYLGLLRQYAEHYQVQILGYCLMTNHVHLIATPPEQASLAKGCARCTAGTRAIVTPSKAARATCGRADIIPARSRAYVLRV